MRKKAAEQVEIQQPVAGSQSINVRRWQSSPFVVFQPVEWIEEGWCPEGGSWISPTQAS